MPTLTAKEKVLANAIQEYCREWCVQNKNADDCKSALCSLHRFRKGYQVQADQTHLFRENDKLTFFSYCDTALDQLDKTGRTNITINDIRKKTLINPVNNNWWGAWARTSLPKLGWSVCGVKISDNESANGRKVSVWVKA